MVSTASQLPAGFYVADSDLRISPGGGWSVIFRKGVLIKSDGKLLYRWDAISEQWKRVNSYNSETPLADFDSWGYEGQQMLAKLRSGLRPVSASEADKLMRPETKELITTAANATSDLRARGVTGSTRVKVIIVD